MYQPLHAPPQKKKKKNRLQSRPRTRDHKIAQEAPLNFQSYYLCETFRKHNNTLQDKSCLTLCTYNIIQFVYLLSNYLLYKQMYFSYFVIMYLRHTYKLIKVIESLFQISLNIQVGTYCRYILYQSIILLQIYFIQRL